MRQISLTETQRPVVSVVIATKDREDQLRTVSLPSLARQQGAPPFEILVWDASDNDHSRKLVEEFGAVNPALTVRYFKAPRVGLARQRNDAVEQAAGEAVFFIDDDSEVSPNGICALAELFTSHPDIAGGCLPLEYNFPAGTEPAILRIKGPFAHIVRIFYNLFEPAKKASGYYPPIPPVASKEIFYLFGCDMAYRREIFASHHFDERLQRFSNYVICDDLIFSRVLLRERRKLRVATSGYVVHHAATGGRLNFGFSSGRIEGYNAALVWYVAVRPWSLLSIVPFLWARAGVFVAVLLPCLRRPWQGNRWSRVAGYISGLTIFLWEEILGMAKSQPHARSS
jgi:glycosyltransferase involved in cell wall biosynthesis